MQIMVTVITKSFRSEFRMKQKNTLDTDKEEERTEQGR